MPHLRAFNFVIEKALAGGASRSLRLDTQGKALGMALLELRLPAPDSLASGRLRGGNAMSESLVKRVGRRAGRHAHA